MSGTTPLPPDHRLISELRLAQTPTGKEVEAEAGTGIMVPEIKTDEIEDAWLRDAFSRCGLTVAQDIIEMGCTGFAGKGFTVEEIKRIRLGLAGSGVGLPCYVGVDRFCFAHNVIGGLQEGQDQRHAAYVNQISRELEASERAHVAVMETARRTPKDDVRDALIGHRVPEEFLKQVGEVIGGPQVPPELAGEAPRGPTATEAEVPAPAAAPVRAGTMMAVVAPAGTPTAPPAIHFQCAACDAVYPWPIPGLPADAHPPERRCPRCFAKPDDAEIRFKCPDHDETTWHCRFCTAAELVRGGLSPKFLMGHAADGTTVMMEDMTELNGQDIAERLKKFEEAGVDGAVLFVKVARWTRKLSRG